MTGPVAAADRTARRAVLRSLVRRVDDAGWLLREAAGLATAQAELAAVEQRLGALVAGSSLTSQAAKDLLSARDGLSVHLEAATALIALDLGGRAVMVLERAVEAVRTGLLRLEGSGEVVAGA